MSRRHDKMVFDYPLLPSADEPAESYDYVNDTYYPQSAPRDIPRQSPRYTATVAPADVFIPAVASGQRDYSYGNSRQIAAYPTPPKEKGYYDDRVRDSTARNSRHSSYDERPPPTDYEVTTIPSSKSQRFYCEIPNCIDENGRRKSVGRKADLKRHMETVHGKPTIDCQYSKCWRRGDEGFRREDHYKEHLRGYHNAQIPKADRSRRSP